MPTWQPCPGHMHVRCLLPSQLCPQPLRWCSYGKKWAPCLPHFRCSRVWENELPPNFVFGSCWSTAVPSMVDWGGVVSVRRWWESDADFNSNFLCSCLWVADLGCLCLWMIGSICFWWQSREGAKMAIKQGTVAHASTGKQLSSVTAHGSIVGVGNEGRKSLLPRAWSEDGATPTHSRAAIWLGLRFSNNAPWLRESDKFLAEWEHRVF